MHSRNPEFVTGAWRDAYNATTVRFDSAPVGRDRATVGDRRRQLSIPTKVPDWMPHEVKLLGTVPDRDFTMAGCARIIPLSN